MNDNPKRTGPGRPSTTNNPVHRQCVTCGKDFTVEFPSIKKKYCSSECYNLKRQAQLITKHCPRCGKDFQINAIYDARYTVCSQECRLSVRTFVDCRRCGKRFRGQKKKDDPTYKRVYCSEACRRPPVYIECRNCKETFRKVPAEDRVFCSFKCYRSYEGETRTEEAVRLSLDQLGITYAQELKVGKRKLDFAIVANKIDIEVDGVYWHDPAKDARRDKYLAKYGWTTIRITDVEIRETSDLAGLIRVKLDGVLLVADLQLR